MNTSKVFGKRIAVVTALLLVNAVIQDCFAAAGDVDLSFDPGSGVNGEVTRMALQPDGKLIVAGWFTTVRGLSRVSLARLNPDGNGEATFNAGTNADRYISAVAVQSDGKVIFTRDFYNPTGGASGHKVARLNTDGGLDTSFVPALGTFPSSSAFTCIAVQPDGRIVLGGYSLADDGFGNFYPRSLLIRLNANGALDNTFTNDNGTFGGSLSTLALQGDGKILIGGDIVTSVNGTNHYNFARFNANGSRDPNFPATGGSAVVSSIVLQPDGKILIASGWYDTGGWIARLNTNGSVDNTFNGGSGANNFINSVLVQSNGKILIGGLFTSVNGTNRNRIARLNSNGSLDTSFNPGAGVDGFVSAAALQPNGNVLIAGNFVALNGAVRPRIARLYGDSLLPLLSIARANSSVIIR